MTKTTYIKGLRVSIPMRHREMPETKSHLYQPVSSPLRPPSKSTQSTFNNSLNISWFPPPRSLRTPNLPSGNRDLFCKGPRSGIDSHVNEHGGKRCASVRADRTKS